MFNNKNPRKKQSFKNIFFLTNRLRVKGLNKNKKKLITE